MFVVLFALWRHLKLYPSTEARYCCWNLLCAAYMFFCWVVQNWLTDAGMNGLIDWWIDWLIDWLIDWFDLIWFDLIWFCSVVQTFNLFIYSFIHSLFFIHSFTHSFIHLHIHSFTHSFLYLFMYSFIHSYSLSLHSPIH